MEDMIARMMATTANQSIRKINDKMKLATDTSSGLLSSDDKKKIDKLPTDGQPYAIVVKRDLDGIYVEM